MTYKQIRAELRQKTTSEQQTTQFLKLDVALEKQIRELEFRVGKLSFEGKSTERELKKLVELKNKKAQDLATELDVKPQVLKLSNLPDIKIKAKKDLAEIYTNLATYAMKFPKTKKANVVLTGNTGTGKTYALTYLGHELIENKVFPLYTTAFGLIDRFKRFIFERDESAFRELLEAEILLLDDLGTEPKIPNITEENLYNLINERLLAKRPFVISTNLTPKELIEKYGERIAGRILANETTAVIKFEGKDMRLPKTI